jgi:hypothetical protein
MNILAMSLLSWPLIHFLSQSLSSVNSALDTYFSSLSTAESDLVPHLLLVGDTNLQNALLCIVFLIVLAHLLAAWSYLNFESLALESGESTQKLALKFWHLSPFRYSLLVLVFSVFVAPVFFLFPPFALILGVWPIHLPLYYSGQPRAALGYTLRQVFSLKFADSENAGRLRSLITIAALSMLCMLVYSFVIFLVENMEANLYFLNLQDSFFNSIHSFGSFDFYLSSIAVSVVFGVSLGSSVTLLAALFSVFWNAFIGKLKLKPEEEIV